jgi:hypothetical protein
MALEYGPMDYGPDDDYVLVPVQTANKIAAALRRLEKLEAVAEVGQRIIASNRQIIIGREELVKALAALEEDV